MEQSPVGHRPAGLFIAAFLMHCYGAGDYGCFIEEKVGSVKFPSYDKTFITALAGEGKQAIRPDGSFGRFIGRSFWACRLRTHFT
jgi:hypothetical protein